jgi:hypothetical protein
VAKSKLIYQLKITLAAIKPPIWRRVQVNDCIYDFGDNWEHVIQVQKVLEADPRARYPLCIDGSRARPPEDCGGPWVTATSWKPSRTLGRTLNCWSGLGAHLTPKRLTWRP